MSWNIRRDFHIDINAAYGSFLIVSATDSSLRQPPPDMVAGDGMPVRFHFWERGPAGTLVAADPGPDTVFIFSGRPAGAPAGSNLLFVTSDFEEISTGVWQGTLDLTAAEFEAHLAVAANGSKIILGELEVRDGASNTKRTSFQFDLTARRQVYNGEIPPLTQTTENWLLGDTAPINEPVPATLTVDPAGADNAFILEAVTPGPAGNDITLEITAPVALQVDPVVEVVDDTNIVVQPGARGVMVITGTLTDGTDPVVFPRMLAVLNYAGLLFTNDGEPWNPADPAEQYAIDATNDGIYRLIKSAGSVVVAEWVADGEYDSPDLVETWIPQGSATGTPVITAQPSATASAFFAFNDSPEVQALVTWSAPGLTTGSLAAVAATRLSGGADPTTAPPYLRVAGGYLHVRESGVWKKIALSAL